MTKLKYYVLALPGLSQHKSKEKWPHTLRPIETQMKMIKQYKSGINTEFRIPTGVSYGYPPEIIEKYFIKIGEDDTHIK